MLQTLILPQQPTVVRRAVLAAGDVLSWIPEACSDVAGHLYHHQVATAGYAFARCHALPGGLLVVEAGLPVPGPIDATGELAASVLPAGPALVARYTGPHENLSGVYAAIDDWLRSADAHRSGDSWEIYRDLPTCAGVGHHLEVVQPITFARISVRPLRT